MNLLYSYASNKTKVQPQYLFKQKETDMKILDTYEYELMDLIQFWDAEHLTRLAQTAYLLYSGDSPTILSRIEHKTRDEADNLDDYSISQIIRSFTLSKELRGYGSDKTFNLLEPKIIQKI